MKKYRNRYRIASARAQWWNYGWSAAYFITICTKNREHLFGEIQNGKMIPSSLGVLADILWHEIPYHIDCVDLGDFVVMPNHIHGILIILPPHKTRKNLSNLDIFNLKAGFYFDHKSLRPSEFAVFDEMDAGMNISGQPAGEFKNEHMANISPKPNTVSTAIRSYKSAVTYHANRLGLKNGWQPRFHDHIIRNDAEFQRISHYIIKNPEKWGDDKFYKP